MERTALDGGQFLQVIGPTLWGQQWNGAPDFVRRWAFVTKRSSGESGIRMVLMKERDFER